LTEIDNRLFLIQFQAKINLKFLFERFNYQDIFIVANEEVVEKRKKALNQIYAKKKSTLRWLKNSSAKNKHVILFVNSNRILNCKSKTPTYYKLELRKYMHD